MGKPYAAEMAQLRETFVWAMGSDITGLRHAIRASSSLPLLAIGSGGSLTAAHALAGLHRRWTGRVAAVTTPLEILAQPLDALMSAWLLSAGGRNVDILAAFRALVGREPQQLGVLCGTVGSPLSEAARRHGFVDLVEFDPPAGKDGFLATNSLLAFTVLMARAYAAEFGNGEGGGSDLADLVEPMLDEKGPVLAAWKMAAEVLWTRDTTLVLHGVGTQVGAIDLESKFTEAALGNLQVADYRNFAHGRHHWLAKRGATSGVLAFSTDGDRALADRTLALIPSDIPIVRLDLAGDGDEAGIASLLAALWISGWAGAARGIDPGRPGVPEFGRKLYHLPLRRKATKAAAPGKLNDDEAVAIERKAGLPLSRLAHREDLQRWRMALGRFVSAMGGAHFGAVVFDYDGTLVDTRARFQPPRADIAAELTRLLEGGTLVGVATGRGASVRRDLQACLPRSLWTRVVVGYYNGAEIGTLDDESVPDANAPVCPELADLAQALRAQSELADVAIQTERRWQITLEPKRTVPENRLWEIACQVVLLHSGGRASIVRSSHSVDILAPGVSKLNVLQRIGADLRADHAVLKIGDRGRWPGNDYDLLRQPFALSVDELSVDPETCWNLAPRGQRGVEATLGYLRALTASDKPGGLRFVWREAK